MVSDARAAPRPTQGDIWAALEEVPDPEIPAISVVDLGIVWSVRVGRGRAAALGGDAIDRIKDGPDAASRIGGAAGPPEGSDAVDRIRVELLPTFVGCPALDVMRETVRERLARLAPDAIIEVEFGYAEPWTSDRISPQGRERLRRGGFAPPEAATAAAAGDGTLPGSLLQVLPRATCPYCGSRRTSLVNPFGPTLCRAIYHCAECRQPFEAFKAV